MSAMNWIGSSTKRPGRALVITACVGTMLTFAAGGAAAADPPNTFGDEVAAIPGAARVVVDDQAPGEGAIREGFKDEHSSITPEWNLALIALDHSDIAPVLNSVAWSESSGYTIYVHSDAEKTKSILSKILPTNGWSISTTPYSKKELLDEAQRILSSPELLKGDQIVQIGPDFDGSGLRLGLLGDPSAKVSLTASDLKSAYPIDIYYRAPLNTASRQADSSPYKGGAIVHSLQGANNYACSTGFKVGTGSPVVSSMLFADHCSSDGWTWQSGDYAAGLGTNAILGYGQGQVGGFIDMERIGSSVNPGGLPATAPYVYVGSAGPSATYTGIYGYTSNPPVGSLVCMSGGYTGQVCNNYVTQVDQIACDPFPTSCWQHQTVSIQQTAAPAAGNGDSGGPVIASIGGRAYAVGIISAVGEFSPTCIGQPASETRHCSVEVNWTPIQQFFTYNSAVLYVAGPS